MELKENPQFSKDYLNPDIRSIASSVTIRLKQGKTLGPCTIEFPLGHKRRRKESLPFLFQKFENNLSTHFHSAKVKEMSVLFQNQEQLEKLTIEKLIAKYTHLHKN
jgi:2-methylcitrate dehydratase